jgi:PhzF family phenazine biosynthesis protein
VTEPFWVTLQGATKIGDTFSRLLMAPPNPAEDPFTGSATGAMAAYLWHNAMIEDRNFIAEQGHWMGRPGQVQVQVLGPQKQIAGVRVAGTGHVLMSGSLFL